MREKQSISVTMTHQHLVPLRTPTTAAASQATLACLWSSTFACVHMGSFNKKGEFPTVPHHLRSPTMAAASQATLDGPPALAIQHPHVHQKGEMNMTTTTTQPQRHNDNCDNRDMPTTTMQQQPQHNNNNHNNTTTTATTTM